MLLRAFIVLNETLVGLISEDCAMWMSWTNVNLDNMYFYRYLELILLT